MRERILEASLRVLNDDGALRFTTSRVAEVAGISVGSLYQYFPNKHALVVALHDDNIDAGWHVANSILDHSTWSGRQKLTELTRWFFASEAAEAEQFGAATGDIDVFLQQQSGDQRRPAMMMAVHDRAVEFIDANSSERRTAARLASDADFLVTSVQAIAKSAAARSRPAAETRRWADRTAAMLADQLDVRR